MKIVGSKIDVSKIFLKINITQHPQDIIQQKLIMTYV